MPSTLWCLTQSSVSGSWQTARQLPDVKGRMRMQADSSSHSDASMTVSASRNHICGTTKVKGPP
jgi:hypothetical protein